MEEGQSGQIELAAFLRDSLLPMHLSNAATPIAAVSDDGAFLDPLLWGSAGPPVVVDANWLRDDLLRFCRGHEQTIMLTAANNGLLRLYCAGHVLSEVIEHSPRWAQEKGLAPSVVREAWEHAYLPLLRWVDPPTGLLAPQEQGRIDVLLRQDRDDVPSATLALLLQAPFISSDKRATEAVYGPGTAVRRRSELLELLRLAGDMVQLGQLGKTAAFVPFAAGSTLFKAAVDSAKTNPLLALLVTGAVGYLALRKTPQPTWRRVGRSVGLSADWGARVIRVHGAWQRSLRTAAPDLPEWHDLGAHIPAASELARALMRTLAHGPRSQMTVAELVAGMPPLPVGQGERATQAALRSHRTVVFQEFPRGRWQLGRSPQPRPRDSRPGHKPIHA